MGELQFGEGVSPKLSEVTCIAIYEGNQLMVGHIWLFLNAFVGLYFLDMSSIST
jgi:hypothetical protein